MENLLTIRDLKIEGLSDGKWSEIVHGISLDVKPGEVVGLIGESGAGKSTIGLAAMGYTRDGCRISGGSVNFDGNELTKIGRKSHQDLLGRRIAYVAQSAAASFNPAHKIIDQYTEGPAIHKVMARKQAQLEAIALFETLQLPNPATIGFRYPHQVSGGQLQRAITAMAMSCKPDLIIFDEPTTALDVTTQIEVLAAIRDVVTKLNTAAIYITHDLAVVAQMADRIKVLRRGHEVEEADTKTMLSAPKEEYTKSLWAVRAFGTPAKPKIAKGAQPILSVKNLTAAYGTEIVLDDVSFDIHKGRTVAVVGESGSGKSTTAKVITGLLPQKQGEVLYEGALLETSFKKRSQHHLKNVQMIFQMADTALNPRQTIGEIIQRPIEFYLQLSPKAARERACEILKELEMEPSQYLHRSPSELSGGQKQRVGIGRALAAEPQLIICDEVTSALDQLVAEGILKLLDKVQQTFGLSYMFITHDLETVRAISDEVVIMQRGKVVEQGATTSIFSPPNHPYTDLLLSSVPEMDPDWLTQLLKQRAQSTAR
jgi:peptide/nickel transport system ATP-binding protein